MWRPWLVSALGPFCGQIERVPEWLSGHISADKTEDRETHGTSTCFSMLPLLVTSALRYNVKPDRCCADRNRLRTRFPKMYLRIEIIPDRSADPGSLPLDMFR